MFDLDIVLQSGMQCSMYTYHANVPGSEDKIILQILMKDLPPRTSFWCSPLTGLICMPRAVPEHSGLIRSMSMQ